MVDTVVPTTVNYRATDLNKTGGRVLDAAVIGPVRISRRGQSFILLRQDTFEALLSGVQDGRPQTLADMLKGYDPQDVKRRLGGWLTDPPVGTELI